MADLDKVIKGLECCTDIAIGCDECPYSDDCERDEGVIALTRDALEMLKAQEPRVMTLEEVLGNTIGIGLPCWIEDHIEDVCVPVLIPAVVTTDDTYVQYSGDDCYEGALYHRDYGKRMRCWTSRPTDEQREATPWDSK